MYVIHFFKETRSDILFNLIKEKFHQHREELAGPSETNIGIIDTCQPHQVLRRVPAPRPLGTDATEPETILETVQ